MTTVEKAAALRALHTAPELLVLVNVWDVTSASAIAALPGSRALATASYSIAAAYGYPDGEAISRELMLEAVGRIVAATELPVSADLEAGYGDPGETVRRAIAVGAVGGNIEDEMRPLNEAVAAVEAAVSAAVAEGVPFVLNARTDAFLRAGDRDREEVIGEAIARAHAFLAHGATCVFIPGKVDLATVARLVDAIGERRISLLALPGGPTVAELEAAGVARVSCGPWSMRVAMTALTDAGATLLAGGALPADTRPF